MVELDSRVRRTQEPPDLLTVRWSRTASSSAGCVLGSQLPVSRPPEITGGVCPPWFTSWSPGPWTTCPVLANELGAG